MMKTNQAQWPLKRYEKPAVNSLKFMRAADVRRGSASAYLMNNQLSFLLLLDIYFEQERFPSSYKLLKFSLGIVRHII